MKTFKFSLILLAFMAFAQTTWAQLPCLPEHGKALDQTAWCGETQPIALTEGWNWVSFYVTNEDPEEMMLMLQTALGENGLTITNGDDYTTYEDGEWGAMGELEELNNEQMYMIEVSADCTVEMHGELADPEDYTIYIYEGWNWIGFPSVQAMSIEDAFADFEAEEGDMITNGDDFTTYEDGAWGAMGDLEEMTPGMGFMYLSNSEETKTLVFSMPTRTAKSAPSKVLVP